MPNILYFVFISECVESVLQFGRFFSSRKFGDFFSWFFWHLLRCGWLESQIATLHRASGSLSSKGRSSGVFHRVISGGRGLAEKGTFTTHVPRRRCSPQKLVDLYRGH